MADFNGDYDSQSKKLKRTTAMADDDIILEIIARLSLKQVIQCSLLNKNLRHWISQPQFQRRATTIFHCSATNPTIFTRFLTSPPSPASVVSATTVTLERETSILASCNGLLLLHMNPYSKHYHVFNPVTGGFMSLNCQNPLNNVGFAVNFDVFKLVAAELGTESDRTVVNFNVFTPSMVSRVKFISPRSFTLAADDNVRPVYAAGSLYWLGDDGGVTLAFDVEKQQARISDGPLDRSDWTGDKWFGRAEDGSIRFVHAMHEEIVIYGHDHVNSVWRVDHRIGNISYKASNNYYRYGKSLYFDGGRLFFLVRAIGEEGEIHIYDVLSKKWEKMRYIFTGWSWLDGRQHFFSFTPTTAKVSDLYLKDLKEKEMEKLEMTRKIFLGLHQLLSPTAN